MSTFSSTHHCFEDRLGLGLGFESLPLGTLGFPFKQTVTTGPNSTDPDVVTAFEYNQRGDIIELRDTAGNVTAYDYDTLGRLLGTKQFNNRKDLLAWDFNYYTTNGEVSWTDGPRYDPEDYVLRDYDGAGRIISEIRWRSEVKEDGSGIKAAAWQSHFLGQSMTTYEYDAFGNLRKIVDPLGHETVLNYDTIGRLISRTHADAATETFTYEPGGEIATSTNTKLGQTQRLYTADGRLKREMRPDGSETAYEYYFDGRLKTVSLQNSSRLEYSYFDGNYSDTTLSNRTAVQTELRIGGTGLGTGTLLSREISVQDGSGNTIKSLVFADANTPYATKMTYDGLNRLVERSGPENFQHPVSGELVSKQIHTNFHYHFDADAGIFIKTSVNGSEEVEEISDALGRTVKINILDSGSLVERTAFTYDPSHHFVTTTKGTSTAMDLEQTVYTDVAGNAVLIRHKDSSFALQKYDKAGNLVQRRDELNRATNYTYDNRNRLATTTQPDGSQTTLAYDSESNLTTRTMPGGLVNTRQFDSANRIEFEELTRQGQVSRRKDYSYFTSGDFTGQLQQVVENTGTSDAITSTLSYDDNGRIASTVNSGLNYADVHTEMTYDFRGLQTEVLRYSPAPTPQFRSVKSEMIYDGSGNLVDETITTGIGSASAFTPIRTHSHFIQKWDAQGRRETLKTGDSFPVNNYVPSFDYSYTASGRLASVTDSRNHALNYSFEDNGLMSVMTLQDAAQTLKTVNIPVAAGRDVRGRILQRQLSALGGTNLHSESVSWRADSKVDAVHMARTSGLGGAWGNLSDNRDYSYNDRGRLTAETFLDDPGTQTPQTDSIDYTFDPDSLGVLTKAKLASEAEPRFAIEENNGTPSGLDAFFRTTSEATDDNKAVDFLATGSTTGPGTFSLYTAAGHNATSGFTFKGNVAPNPSSGDGLWSHSLQLPPGDYTLRAEAKHLNPSSNFTVTDESSFTVSSTSAESRTNTYDPSGRLKTRVIDGGNVTQNFEWDAAGRLLSMTQLDSRNPAQVQNFTIHYLYDSRGRRLVTSYEPEGASIQKTRALYDPSVAFQEIAIEKDSGVTWKLMGRDLSGGFGALQGIGAVHAFIDGGEGEITPALQDFFGNVIGSIDTAGTASTADDTVVWNEIQVSGYGALPGYELKSAEHSDMPHAHAWRGKRPDPSGLIYMGFRFYDPTSGRFLSPDPLGHAASMDLYSYAGGDPVNFVDPTGLTPQQAAAVWEMWTTTHIDQFMAMTPDQRAQVMKSIDVLYAHNNPNVNLDLSGVAWREPDPINHGLLGDAFLWSLEASQATVEFFTDPIRDNINEIAIGITVVSAGSLAIMTGGAAVPVIAEAAVLTEASAITYTGFTTTQIIGATIVTSQSAVALKQGLEGGFVVNGYDLGTMSSPAGLIPIVAGATGEIINSLTRGASADAANSVEPLCFLAGTLVDTPEGKVSIETIMEGDIVYCFDHDTNEVTEAKVSRVMDRLVDSYYILDIGSETIRVTAEHPFWTGNKYTEVKGLSTDHSLFNIQSARVGIESIDTVYEHTIVYNITVDGSHNYYVGDQSILVHNKGN